MKKEQNLKTERSILINSGAEQVWDTLTNPLKIKKYLFGSDTVTNWKVGNPITFTRFTQGHQWQDKGEILEVIPEKLLKFNYWSSQEGYEDIPENYSIITYTLDHKHDKMINLMYCRENIPLEFEQMNQEKYLPGMLAEIKKIAEEK